MLPELPVTSALRLRCVGVESALSLGVVMLYVMFASRGCFVGRNNPLGVAFGGACTAGSLGFASALSGFEWLLRAAVRRRCVGGALLKG